MNIVMEPGASMLTDTFLNEIDLSEAGDVSSGSEALLIEPDKPVDPVGSLAISIPLSLVPLLFLAIAIIRSFIRHLIIKITEK